MKKQNESTEINVAWSEAGQTYLIRVGNVFFSLNPTEACQLHDDLTFTSSFVEGYIRRSEHIWAEYAVSDISGWTISVGPVEIEISDEDAERVRDILDVVV